MNIEQVWPEWQVEKIIGKGSYGTVYKCFKIVENNKKEYCAVKVVSVPQDDFEITEIDSEKMSNEQTQEYYKDIVDGFVDEIKILESLKNTKNVVNIYDSKVLEKTDGIGWQIFIQMELLTDFNTHASDKTFSVEDVKKITLDLCEALKVCSEKKIIHRDIKPENIFIDSEGNYKLGDFGVAKQLEKTNASMSIKGTYNYMAPEVISAKRYDTRADIYSLGIVMYKLLNNNRLPFLDPNKQIIRYSERQEAFERRVHGEKIPPIANIDEKTNSIILKACEFKPEDRYKNIEEFCQALSDGSDKHNLLSFAVKHKVLSAISLLLVFSIVTVSVGYYIKHKPTDNDDGKSLPAGLQPSVIDEHLSSSTENSTTSTTTSTTTTTTEPDELSKYYKKPDFTFVEPTSNDWYNLGSDENNDDALVYVWPTYGFENGYDCKKLTSKNIIQSLIGDTGYCDTYTQYFEEPIPINYVDSPDPLKRFSQVMGPDDSDSQYYKYPLSNISWLIDNIYNVKPEVTTKFDSDVYDIMPYYYEGAYYFAAPKCGDGGFKKRIADKEKISTGVYRVKIETAKLAGSVESEDGIGESEDENTSPEYEFVVTGEMVVGLKLINEKRYWSLYEYKNLEQI